MSLSKDARSGGIQVGNLQSVPGRLKCSICTFVLRDPVQGVCGHRYCKVCIASAGALDCIECKDEGEDPIPRLSAESVKADTAMMRELNKTEFYCPWEPQCNVRMKLQDLIKHSASECSHRRIECDLKCGMLLAASEMEKHIANECPMKPKQCDMCQEFVPQDQMEMHLDSVCIKNTKQCESCTTRVRDSDEARIKHYNEVCPIKWMDNHECPFGCGLVQDAKAHREDCAVLHVDRLKAMLKQGKQVSDVAGSTGQEVISQPESQPHERVLEDLNDKIVTGEIINGLSRYGLPHCPKQTREIKEQKEFFDRINFAFSVDKALEKEFYIMDRKLKDAYGTVDQISAQMQQQQEELVRASDTYSLLLRSMAMKELRICELDRNISLQELGSTDGTLVWKIPFFRERLMDTEYEPIVPSPILFAEKFGYKLSAVAYLNGHSSGHGTHLSLFARLLQGPYDAAQRWPFRRTVTFTLMDQSGANHLVKEFKPDQSSQFQRPSQPIGQMFGFERFALKDELESKGFLKDDTLFVKLHVSKPTLTQGDF